MSFKGGGGANVFWQKVVLGLLLIKEEEEALCYLYRGNFTQNEKREKEKRRQKGCAFFDACLGF